MTWLCVCVGGCISGDDHSSGHHLSADAADPSAAGPEPPAAPTVTAATTGPDVTAGTYTSVRYSSASAATQQPKKV